MAERLGIPGRATLDESGACPACGVTWPAPDRCQVCGGPAKLGDWWRVLGAPRPTTDRLSVLASHAAGLAEIAPGEAGIQRTDVTRLLFLLYGHDHKRVDIYRWAWRLLLKEYFAGRSLGERRALFDMRPEPGKKPGSKKVSQGTHA